jgi:Tfp pilus assembly protein PilN
MMHDIDFLPASYREAGVQRKNVGLRVVVIVLFVGVVGYAAIYQQYLRRLSEQQLADIMPHYEMAKLETARLTRLQQQLKSAEKRAELCTYLRHPWPRSQILAAVAESLPDEVQLSSLEILAEPLPSSELEAPRPAGKAGEAAIAKLDPAHRDLLALRDQCDKSRVIVKLSGITSDTPALHHYFEQLGQLPLFEKVDVNSVQHQPGDAASEMHFAVRLIVRPGYGQPSGPTPPAETVTSINHN